MKDKLSLQSAVCRTLLVMLLVACTGFTMHQDLQAQDRAEVSGTVFDGQTGTPLPGASIIVQDSQEATGSIIGTTTNMDGQFTLMVPSDLNVLVVSFIGYITQEVTIDGRSDIEITLQADVQLLENIVVVGYGIQDKREIPLPSQG